MFGTYTENIKSDILQTMTKQVDDISFANAVKKIIKKEYPNVTNLSKIYLNAVSDCTKEFAKLLIASTAVECDKHGTLVVAEDVKQALKTIGYENYIPTVEAQASAIKSKKEAKPKPKESDLSQQELIELQDRLYRESLAELKRRDTLGY